MAVIHDISEDAFGQVLFPIRCRSCGTLTGWGTEPRPGIRFYCLSPECRLPNQTLLGENERRNDLIRAAVAAGWTAHKTAEYFSLTRQRVSQMLYPKIREAG